MTLIFVPFKNSRIETLETTLYTTTGETSGCVISQPVSTVEIPARASSAYIRPPFLSPAPRSLLISAQKFTVKTYDFCHYQRINFRFSQKLSQKILH